MAEIQDKLVDLKILKQALSESVGGGQLEFEEQPSAELNVEWVNSESSSYISGFNLSHRYHFLTYDHYGYMVGTIRKAIFFEVFDLSQFPPVSSDSIGAATNAYGQIIFQLGSSAGTLMGITEGSSSTFYFDYTKPELTLHCNTSTGNGSAAPDNLKYYTAD